MEAYIINTSIGFVNDNRDEFIEIAELNEIEEIKKLDNSFMRKIRNFLKIKSNSNKIDIENMV
jgi:hypothetical protein